MNGMSLNTYKVVFHANGANGSMAPQRFTIGSPKKLRKCTFSWPSSNMKIFNGWTTEANPKDDIDAMYSD